VTVFNRESRTGLVAVDLGELEPDFRLKPRVNHLRVGVGSRRGQAARPPLLLRLELALIWTQGGSSIVTLTLGFILSVIALICGVLMLFSGRWSRLPLAAIAIICLALNESGLLSTLAR
jgi:hypothetical protein